MNYCISLGQEQGGGIWLQQDGVEEEQVNDPTNDIVWKQDAGKAWIPGKFYNTRNQFLMFDPHYKHATQGWSGERWGLAYHTVRGLVQAGNEVKKCLKNCGFPFEANLKKGKIEKNKAAKPSKSVRNKIFNTAGKLSVMMASLMMATGSITAEAGGPVAEYDPIVMMELGGVEGTIEAVDLGKAVIEPMSWEHLKEPEKQENAHHFVVGASPKELRIHLRDMPNMVQEFVKDLIGEQLEEGGDVVLRGQDVPTWIKEFEEYKRYESVEEDDAWIVVSKPKKGAVMMKGRERPHEVCTVEVGADGNAGRRRQEASGISFDESVPQHVQSALRRLHQNLGHPRKEDLLRHLRLAGCEDHIIKAVKGMHCETCKTTQGPGIARGTTLPRLLDFNSCVGVDIFYVHDIRDKKHAFLSMVDWATTYHVVKHLEKETGEDVERAFNDAWLNVFGPPASLSLDLDGKVQGGLARLCDWHSMKVKDVAAQAHWQAGVTERQGGWFKAIWDRVVQELSVEDEEVVLAATMVCGAKNDLRRRCGHSPTQWVFGRSPRVPSELADPDGGEAVTWDLTLDSKFQRSTAIRASARIAFHQAQGDDRLRKGLMQRSRAARAAYDVGDPVHYWHQPKDRRRARWIGPAVVVGKQGSSYWVSRNGRCRLTAPEHLRATGAEELGEFLTMKGVKREVEKLLSMDIDDPKIYEEEEEEERPRDEEEDWMAEYEPSIPAAEEEDREPVQLDMEIDEEIFEEEQGLPEPRRRLKRKTRPEALTVDNNIGEVMLTRKELTKRGQAKRQEKELLWKEIPDHAKEKFKQAEQAQWDEHLSFDALQPLDTETSNRVKATYSEERILRCRWAYKDKNWAARCNGQEVEWKCKSRLVTGGHKDPDLGVQELTTDAPTLSRTGFMCMMQRLANGLELNDKNKEKWSVAAGDIRCAFLTGGYLSRDNPLFLHQPPTGFPGMLPGQLVKIKKNIFGLATSPHEWWQNLQEGILTVEIEWENKKYKFEPCPLDPCVFMLREKAGETFRGRPIGYVGSHVDDLLVIAARRLNRLIQKKLSDAFPVDDWIEDSLDYLGSEMTCGDSEVTSLKGGMPRAGCSWWRCQRGEKMKSGQMPR